MWWCMGKRGGGKRERREVWGEGEGEDGDIDVRRRRQGQMWRRDSTYGFIYGFIMGTIIGPFGQRNGI